MKIISVYEKYKKYLNNTFWIIGDKLTNLVVGFLVTVVVARYLGPEDFGLFSYAISVSTLFSVIGHMGISGLVVREIVKKPSERGVTLGTTFGLKLLGMSTGYFFLLLYAFIYEGVSSMEFQALAIAGAILLVKPFDIIDFWFQAFVQAIYVAYARLLALVVSAVIKLVFVSLGLSVVYFVTANLIQAIAIAILFILVYKFKSELKLNEWHFSWEKAKELLSQGWIVYLGSFFAVIYLKVDQIMLRWFEGSESVGIYSVAAQLSEAWYFIPVAIVSSLFPKLIKLKEKDPEQFNKRLQQLFDLLFIVAVGVAVIMSLLSEWIVLLFFGDYYIDSANVLVIHIWAAIFIFMRAAFSKWILIENVLFFSLITQGTGALVNVVINYFLIPKFGVQGAAYATLISYAFASFFSLALYSKTRPIFVMMAKSVISPIRYYKFKGC
ncbi:flippase [Salinivibrio sp. ES.052]|uniref:flippase n=1 Tax=Salinivibrio sp. ES.052 TaxID=1882823 RepID=UPI00092B0569|nr:flippase [Salinivibrio sp. ES.052]SIN79205.1 Membrane protein involved in the export of O-antigen and teichoic acid [Salinivibrio sp. ES.052]